MTQAKHADTWRMAIAALAIVLAAAVPEPACSHDWRAILTLDEAAFDQGWLGWRSVDERAGCEAVAADLIRDYRHRYRLPPHRLAMHEAQMRASAGDYRRARPLFVLAKHKTDGFGWNDYIDSTLAFLDRDRATLLAARARLAATPRPETHPWFDDLGAPIAAPTLPPGTEWPYNLPVVDALIRCFDRSYKDAYGNVECYAKSAH